MRVQLAVIAAQVIAILFFTLWPEPEPPVYTDFDSSDVAIAIDEVVITRHVNTPPPPPKPRVPVPIPSDEIIEDEIIELDEMDFNDLPDFMEVDVESENFQAVTDNPDRPPYVVKIVEPIVPEEARKSKLKAEILVTFLVDAAGKVEEVSIAEIKMFDTQAKEYKVVRSVPYGLVGATMNAAAKWRFIPAKHEGEKVRSYTRHVFMFGS